MRKVLVVSLIRFGGHEDEKGSLLMSFTFFSEVNEILCEGRSCPLRLCVESEGMVPRGVADTMSFRLPTSSEKSSVNKMKSLRNRFY